jgi:hypothetical protein
MPIQGPNQTRQKAKRRLMSFKQFIQSSHATSEKQSKMNRELVPSTATLRVSKAL